VISGCEVAVSIFRSQAAAQKAKSVLDQAGIESELRSDPSNMHWVPTQGKHFAESNATQLMVRAEDVDKAGEVLRKATVDQIDPQREFR
jgi:hypothetical protein